MFSDWKHALRKFNLKFKVMTFITSVAMNGRVMLAHVLAESVALFAVMVKG